jgi:hypothetical protein
MSSDKVKEPRGVSGKTDQEDKSPYKIDETEQSGSMSRMNESSLIKPSGRVHKS